MVSSTTTQDLVQSVRLTTQGSYPDFDALRSSIFNITMHAFLADVLTLERMRSVIQAVCTGVADNSKVQAGLAADTLVLAHTGAYQGLCQAAGQGLTAAGLAFTQFALFHGSSLPGEVGVALVHEALALRRQIDQVTHHADWLSNSDITLVQARGFQQLLQPSGAGAKQSVQFTLAWTERFFQEAQYQPLHATSHTTASLMLLGLLTSGALTGLRASQAAA